MTPIVALTLLHSKNAHHALCSVNKVVIVNEFVFFEVMDNDGHFVKLCKISIMDLVRCFWIGNQF